MNGMENITARMEADAQRASDELRERTERQLAAMRRESEKRAEQERLALSARADQAAQERYERLCSAAEMECRKLALAARREVLDEAYALALEGLCSMPREEYLALLLKLLQGVASGGETLRLSRADRAAIGEELAARAKSELGLSLALSQENAPIRAGFLLESGSCSVNCSMETLLALSRERTERGAADILFGASEERP